MSNSGCVSYEVPPSFENYISKNLPGDDHVELRAKLMMLCKCFYETALPKSLAVLESAMIGFLSTEMKNHTTPFKDQQTQTEEFLGCSMLAGDAGPSNLSDIKVISVDSGEFSSYSCDGTVVLHIEFKNKLMSAALQKPKYDEC